MLRKSVLAATAALTLSAAAPAPQEWQPVCKEVTETVWGAPVWVPMATQVVQVPPYAGWANAGGSPVLGGDNWSTWTGNGGKNDFNSGNWGNVEWSEGSYGYGPAPGWEVWSETTIVHINPNPTHYGGVTPWKAYTVTCTNTRGATTIAYGAGGGWEQWEQVTTGSNGAVITVTMTATTTATGPTVTVAPILTGTTSTTTTTGGMVISPVLTGTTSTPSSTTTTTTTTGNGNTVAPTLITTTTTTVATTVIPTTTVITTSGTTVITTSTVITTLSTTLTIPTVITTTTTTGATVVISPTVTVTTSGTTVITLTAAPTIISTTSSTSTSSSTSSSSTTTSSDSTTSTSTSTSTTSGSTSTSTSTTSTSTSSTSTTTTSMTTTTSGSSTTTTSTTTATGACATITGAYVLQGSGTGDFTVDGNFAQLQSAFGSGYRVTFNANRQGAQQFRFRPDCSLVTADNNLQAMIGGNANLHYQYFFPSTQAAAALINVNWEADVCNKNADNTLTCTAMGQSIFQVTQGDPLLQLGDQNYGEALTINLIPVPGSIFKN